MNSFIKALGGVTTPKVRDPFPKELKWNLKDTTTFNIQILGLGTNSRGIFFNLELRNLTQKLVNG